VPIGDRFTMGAKLAALACARYFTFDTVIPAHFATFGLLDPDESKFVEAMHGSKTKVLVPERGVAVDL
jgi:L-ascorbate metabolism protein UlaG (beta-lactamase superfamily)